MGTATQIVHLKRLALTTSRHLPHNDHYLNFRIYSQRFNASLDEPTKRGWFNCSQQREELVIDSVSHLIGRNME